MKKVFLMLLICALLSSCAFSSCSSASPSSSPAPSSISSSSSSSLSSFSTASAGNNPTSGIKSSMSTSTQATTPAISANTYTAMEVVTRLKDSGLQIINPTVYDKNTDLDKLLGQPNQYTGKVSFDDFETTAGALNNSVEVFANATDAKDRVDYLKSVTAANGTLPQGLYQIKIYVLRLDYSISPDTAKKYEYWFDMIVNNIEKTNG